MQKKIPGLRRTLCTGKMANAKLIVPLVLCLVGFIIAVALILYSMFKKHRSQEATLSPPLFPTQGRRKERYSNLADNDFESKKGEAAPAIGDTDVNTRAQFVIPHGLQLLRKCKELTHRLLACAIDGTSKEHECLVVGSIESIIEASREVNPKVDDLTKCMYPPIKTEEMRSAASSLLTAIEHLVMVTRRNCNIDKLAWLDEATTDVVGNFEELSDAVERFQRAEKLELTQGECYA